MQHTSSDILATVIRLLTAAATVWFGMSLIFTPAEMAAVLQLDVLAAIVPPLQLIVLIGGASILGGSLLTVGVSVRPVAIALVLLLTLVLFSSAAASADFMLWMLVILQSVVILLPNDNFSFDAQVEQNNAT